jgi:hypothetical protein
MRDHRLSRRVPSILEGRIRLAPEAPSIVCTIRDLSATGARIWLPDVVVFPNEFELEIPMLEQTIRARAVWSKGKQHGLMFLQALQDLAGGGKDDVLETFRNLDRKT